MTNGRTVLRIDVDGPTYTPADVEYRRRLLCAMLGVRVRHAGTRKTRRGYHVTLEVPRRYGPLAVVAMQAVLGSDYRREMFNLVRALGVRHVPRVWRGRSNVLYARTLCRPKKRRGEDATMAKVNSSEFGRVALRPEDIEGDAAILTVERVERGTWQGQKRMMLHYKELPGKTHFLNATGVKALVEHLGDDDDHWVGLRVPVVKARTDNPQTGEPMTVVWIATADDALWNRAGSKARPAGRGRRAAR